MRTDAVGRLTLVEILHNVFFSIPRGVQKRKLNGEHSVARNEPVRLFVGVVRTVNDIGSIRVVLGCAAAASALGNTPDAILQQQTTLFQVRLIKDADRD